MNTPLSVRYAELYKNCVPIWETCPNIIKDLTKRKWYMFWRRNKDLENKVFQLESKIKCLEADLENECYRSRRLFSITNLTPNSPNSGFFVVYVHDKTEEKEKEWIAKGWRLKDKAENIELWVKD